MGRRLLCFPDSSPPQFPKENLNTLAQLLFQTQRSLSGSLVLLARQHLTLLPTLEPTESHRRGEEGKSLWVPFFPTENLLGHLQSQPQCVPRRDAPLTPSRDEWLKPRERRWRGRAWSTLSPGRAVQPPRGHRPQNGDNWGGENKRDVLDGGEARGEAGRGGFGEQRTARQVDGDETSVSDQLNKTQPPPLSLPTRLLLTPPAVPFWMSPSAAQEKSPVASRKQVEDFLFLSLSLVLERRIGRFSSSAGDSGCSSSDSTTLASPFCLESAGSERAISS